jgi:putative transposase
MSETHSASRGTYGAPRLHAEMCLGRRVIVGHNQSDRLILNAGLLGLPLKRRFKNASRAITAEDLVHRDFSRAEPKQLCTEDRMR